MVLDLREAEEGFEDAFEDLGDLVGPFMFQLQSLASEFYAGGVAGGTFKDTMKTVLGVVFEVATRTVRAVHIAFLELEVAFLKAKIAVAPLTSALKDLGIEGGIVNVVMYLIGATALILAVVFGILALAVFLVALPFLMVAAVIVLVILGIRKLINIISEASDHMDDMGSAVTGWIDGIVQSINGMATAVPGALAGFVVSALSAGGNFVLGLVQALTTGQGPVADAAKSLALAAKNAVFSAMGIASPSRVMIQAGRHVSAGFALGIDDGAGDVEAAAQGTASAAVSGAAVPRGGSQAGGRGDVTVNVEAGAIVSQGAGGSVLELTEEAVARVFELMAARVGLAPVGA